jgi:RNA polymerase sigma factor (sigma-70 family)
MTFKYEDLKPILVRHACHYHRLYPHFDIDELISAAWLQNPCQHKTLEKASLAIRRDMIDFTRGWLRKHIKYQRAIGRIRKESQNYVMNDDLKRIEDKEFVDFLMDLADLSDREKQILYLYFYKGLTHTEIATLLSVSAPLVSYIKLQSFKKIRLVKENEDD